MRREIRSPAVAMIDEETCIGCTLCIEACPVDAIAGASKLMHTVIAAECIGCRLCLPPCPVDCITMVETGISPTREERKLRAAHARLRYVNRLARRKRERVEHAAPRENAAERRKRATVERVMQRARQRLQRRGTRTE
jgi:electron transport complex protein RnfB